MFIATLIAEGLTERQVNFAYDLLDRHTACGADHRRRWIDKGWAADISLSRDPGNARALLESEFPDLDVIVQPEQRREKKLLVSDMDSTMITVECIDELAEYAGIKPEIAAITERAMAGELDFEAALIARVALLEGLPVAVLAQCHDERVRFMPGARTLVATMRARGAKTVLVSGGFTQFAYRVAETLGFHQVVSNTLGIRGARLDGTVARPIVGAEAKRAALLDAMTSAGLAREDTLAIGDGANDVPMIEAAGLGVAYRAKPVVEAAADASIRHADLTALLWAQGIPRAGWVP